MPDTKTQAEGTPCSLVLQPNSKIGVRIYTVNSEHKFKMSIRSIWLDGGLASVSYQHVVNVWNSLPGHVVNVDTVL